MSAKSELKEQALIFLGNIKEKEDPISWAIRRAYGDMSRRTLRFRDDVPDEKKSGLKKEASKIIVDHLNALAVKQRTKGTAFEEKDFDDWHECLSGKLQKEYKDATEAGGLTVGQTQKWINMTLKYLWVYEIIGLEHHVQLPELAKLLPFLHIPIDRAMLVKINKRYNLTFSGEAGKDNCSWSKICEYKEYLCYQKRLRCKLKEDPEFETLAAFELHTWNRVNE